MIELRLTFPTVEEAAAFLAGKTKAAAETGTTGKPGGAVKTDKPADSKPSADTVKTAASEPKAETTKPAADVPSYEKSGIPEKIQTMVGKDKPAIIKLLGEFGVKKGGELKPEQFADFTKKIDALLGGGEDLS